MSLSNSTPGSQPMQTFARINGIEGHSAGHRLYQSTFNYSGHLHQGDHYGDKVYNIYNNIEDTDSFQTSCETLEVSQHIEQFVESVWSLLASNRRLIPPEQTPNSSSTTLEEVDNTLKSLRRMLNDARTTRVLMGPDDPNVLIQDCKQIIEDVLEMIDDIRESFSTSWPLISDHHLIIRNAVIIVRGQDYINHLTKKLEMVRKQMCQSVINTISCHMSHRWETITPLEDMIKEYGGSRYGELSNLAELVQARMDQLSHVRVDEEMQLIYHKMMNGEAEATDFELGEKALLQRLLKALRQLEDQVSVMESNLKLLGSLHFKIIEERHRSIVDAYESTFMWIFDDNVSFKSWLRSKSGAFLLQGKAGSGKSTWMKFVYDHPKTTELLKEWAGRKRLVLAKHFFWRTGSKLQKSIVGLLRTLLFEILRAQPELTRHLLHVVGTIALEPSSGDTHWTRRLLETALKYILHGGHEISAKFCFFIDGLDEFEESDEFGENQGQLLLTLKSFSNVDHVKFCVSSRPSGMLSNALLGDSDSRIQLEDLTHSDIKSYVKRNFEEHQQLFRCDVLTDELATAVVDRAEGVFLWVFLVVRSLSTGALDGEDSHMLMDRLKTFPQGIGQLFGHMMDDVDQERLPETALLFWMATSIDEPELSLAVIYSAVDDVLTCGNIEEFLAGPQKIMTELEVDTRVQRLRKNLDIRSKGMLEIRAGDNSYLSHTVDYLHRSVGEYLSENNIADSMTEKHLLSQFGKTWPLIPCAATLAVIRRWPLGLNIELSLCLCETMFAFASAAERKLGSMELLSDLLETAEKEWRAKWPGYGRQWMMYACEAHVFSYIRRQHPLHLRSLLYCETSGHRMENTAPLTYALKMSPSHAQSLTHDYFAKQRQAVEFILSQNADPNRWDFDYDTTPWKEFVKLAHSYSRLEGADEKLLSTVKLLLRHGADLEAEIRVRGDVSLTAREVLQRIFSTSQMNDLLHVPESKRHLEGMHIVVAGLEISSLAFVVALRKLWGYNSRPPRITIICGRGKKEDFMTEGQAPVQIFGHGAPEATELIKELGLDSTALQTDPQRANSFRIWNSDWTEMTSWHTMCPKGQENFTGRVNMRALRQALIDAVELTDEIRWDVICLGARKMPSGKVEIDVKCTDPDASCSEAKAIFKCDLLITGNQTLSSVRCGVLGHVSCRTAPESNSMAVLPDTCQSMQDTGFIQIQGKARFDQGLPSQMVQTWGLKLLGSGACCFLCPLNEKEVLWEATLRKSPELGSDHVKLATELKHRFRTDYGEWMERIIDATEDPKTIILSKVQHQKAITHTQNEASIIFLGKNNHSLPLFAGYGAGLCLNEGTELARRLYNATSLKDGVSSYDAVMVPRINAALRLSLVWMDIAHSRGLKFAFYKAYLCWRGLLQNWSRTIRNAIVQAF